MKRSFIIEICFILIILTLLCACKNTNSIESSSSKSISEIELTDVLPPIIWLGDSLTQGSLGDDNCNENNPQAPWRVVANNYDVDIIGYGYYGYNTHDILWKYGKDGGKKISDNIYVFWVGSNDFVQSDTAITDVIGEIDRFVEAGDITRYIVIGTTDRKELGREKAVTINEKLKDAYGPRYMDILDYVEYGPDDIHLTEDSYYKIGIAVYDKIVSTYLKQ